MRSLSASAGWRGLRQGKCKLASVPLPWLRRWRRQGLGRRDQQRSQWRLPSAGVLVRRRSAIPPGGRSVLIGTRGIDVLLSKAIAGFNAMPPKGTCATCSDDELMGAIKRRCPACNSRQLLKNRLRAVFFSLPLAGWAVYCRSRSSRRASGTRLAALRQQFLGAFAGAGDTGVQRAATQRLFLVDLVCREQLGQFQIERPRTARRRPAAGARAFARIGLLPRPWEVLAAQAPVRVAVTTAQAVLVVAPAWA